MPTPSETEAQTASDRLASPGAEHGWMQPLVGRWAVAMRVWPGPSAEPFAIPGMTAERHLILGGRYLREDLIGAEGVVTREATLGYNRLEGRFELVTVDAYEPGPSSDAAVVVEPRWPQPQVATSAAISGPVLVTIAYDIVPESEAEFTALMRQIARTRRSSGTLAWDLFRHGAEPGQWLETNLVASWDDHLRQRSRQTAEAQNMEAALRAFLKPGCEPRVTHWLAT